MAGTRLKFDPTIDYYQILDVPYTATKAEITRSYRALIRHAHPDRFMDEAERQKAEERAKLLNAAYAVLTRAEARREYDQVIRQRAVNEAIFQRYTGSVPGQGQAQARRATRRPVSPAMSRAQRRANRSAFTHFVLFVVIFIAALALLLIFGSIATQLLHLIA
jgi:curved DNA-binding protein CbpA